MKYPEIARRFTEILNEKGWKAQELADRSGMTKAAISHYVNGKRCPTNKTASQLGKVLGVNPLWLMDLSGTLTVFLIFPYFSDKTAIFSHFLRVCALN